jgi:hypothetical protein
VVDLYQGNQLIDLHFGIIISLKLDYVQDITFIQAISVCLSIMVVKIMNYFSTDFGHMTSLTGTVLHSAIKGPIPSSSRTLF